MIYTNGEKVNGLDVFWQMSLGNIGQGGTVCVELDYNEYAAAVASGGSTPNNLHANIVCPTGTFEDIWFMGLGLTYKDTCASL